MSAGFYKLVAGQGILYAPSFVHAPGYSLNAENRATTTFPVDGWYWFDSQAEAETAFVSVFAAPTSAVTKLAFRHRFTPAERVAMEIAQIDDPTATMQARHIAASLRSSSADMMAALYIDLAKADTQAGVQALEALGIIGAGRAQAILTAAVASSERP